MNQQKIVHIISKLSSITTMLYSAAGGLRIVGGEDVVIRVKGLMANADILSACIDELTEELFGKENNGEAK